MAQTAEQLLDDLAEHRRLKQAELAEAEELFRLLDRNAKAGLSATEAKWHAQLREALPKARAKVKEIDDEISAHRDAIARGATTARQRPLSERDRQLHAAAVAYRDAAAATERAAKDFAAKARTALVLGNALAAVVGSDAAFRLFMPGHFRQRLTAGVLRFLEIDPDAAGQWGTHGALIELGDAKRVTSIARLGFAESERLVACDLLPENVGGTL